MHFLPIKTGIGEIVGSKLTGCMCDLAIQNIKIARQREKGTEESKRERERP